MKITFDTNDSFFSPFHRFTGSGLMDHIKYLHDNPAVSMFLLIGEVMYFVTYISILCTRFMTEPLKFIII